MDVTERNGVRETNFNCGPALTVRRDYLQRGRPTTREVPSPCNVGIGATLDLPDALVNGLSDSSIEAFLSTSGEQV
jgi:hypothetical protein